MWEYSNNIDDKFITNCYLRDLMPDNQKGYFTKEGIRYIRHIMNPFITYINTITTLTLFNEFIQSIPYCTNYYNNIDKHSAGDEILLLLIYNANIYRIDDYTDPWDIQIRISISSRRIRTFLNTPSVITNVYLNGIYSNIVLSRHHILGIMVIYRYLKKDHPLSMYGKKLLYEVNQVNNMPSDIGTDTGWYNVEIGSDIYSFKNIEFFQGILTACQWNNLLPVSCIISLKQWQDGNLINLKY